MLRAIQETKEEEEEEEEEAADKGAEIKTPTTNEVRPTPPFRPTHAPRLRLPPPGFLTQCRQGRHK